MAGNYSEKPSRSLFDFICRVHNRRQQSMIFALVIRGRRRFFSVCPRSIKSRNCLNFFVPQRRIS